MEEASNESIKVSVEESSINVPIFDHDYWTDEKSGISAEKSTSEGTLNDIQNPMT